MLKVSENLEEMGEIRIPVGSRIAGAVAQSGKSIRIDDAYADPRFNREVDKQTGFQDPVHPLPPGQEPRGEVFAVAQLLNRKDGQPFDHDDEQQFASFIQIHRCHFRNPTGARGGIDR